MEGGRANCRQVEFFATAAKGTEGALRDELREIGLRRVKADRGGVHFEGPPEDGYRACLHSRVAMRVLRPLATFPSQTEGELYDGIRGVDWSEFLTQGRTLAVRATCADSSLTHTLYIAQKTKDAVVDQLRDAAGARPSVDIESPDVTICVHLVRDVATVYVDLAGEPLHRRGYRVVTGDAPLKETLAAAMVRLSGWDRVSPFVDPMCGAGTIAIEAALWARNVAPGLSRERFGFERWACHDEATARRVAELRERARAKVLTEGPPVRGSDVDLAALAAARENARDAGVAVEWTRASVRALAPAGEPGLVVTNPPYGERLDAPDALYRDMADAFRRLEGWRVAILAGTPAIERAMRRRADKALAVFNGDIECRLLVYDIG